MQHLPLTDLRFFTARQSGCAQPSNIEASAKEDWSMVFKNDIRNPFKCSNLKLHSFVKSASNTSDGPTPVSLQMSKFFFKLKISKRGTQRPSSYRLMG